MRRSIPSESIRRFRPAAEHCARMARTSAAEVVFWSICFGGFWIRERSHGTMSVLSLISSATFAREDRFPSTPKT